MTRLFLIRHGEPEASWGGPVDDPGLSEAGQGQAEAAAAGLAAFGPLKIISSPMRRCQETAAPYVAARNLAPLIEPRVSEVASPADVSDRRAWLLQNFPWQGGAMRQWPSLAPALLTWRADMLGFARALGDDCAVFTHFIAINVIVGAALARDETIVCKPGYASITELAVNNGELKLVKLDEGMRVGEVR
jgi:broad specificity phosphatase PhoE